MHILIEQLIWRSYARCSDCLLEIVLDSVLGVLHEMVDPIMCTDGLNMGGTSLK